MIWEFYLVGVYSCHGVVNILGWEKLMTFTPSTKYCTVRHSTSFAIPQLSPTCRTTLKNWAYFFVTLLAWLVNTDMINITTYHLGWLDDFFKQEKKNQPIYHVTRKLYLIMNYHLSPLLPCLRGYCTPGPYFWRLCAFSQKIKQLRT